MNVHQAQISKSTPSENKRDIYGRIYKFVLICLDLIRTLPTSMENQIVARQLIRSVTSIGANAQEADGSESKAEFVHRWTIAKKEAKESHYWLSILKDHGATSQEKVEPLLSELTQLIKIISAIVIKIKNQ